MPGRAQPSDPRCGALTREGRPCPRRPVSGRRRRARRHARASAANPSSAASGGAGGHTAGGISPRAQRHAPPTPLRPHRAARSATPTRHPPPSSPASDTARRAARPRHAKQSIDTRSRQHLAHPASVRRGSNRVDKHRTSDWGRTGSISKLQRPKTKFLTRLVPHLGN